MLLNFPYDAPIIPFVPQIKLCLNALLEYLTDFLPYSHTVPLCIMQQNFSCSGNQFTKIVPIMLALCSMLLATYYAPNYASIIGTSLIRTIVDRKKVLKQAGIVHDSKSIKTVLSLLWMP